MKLFRRCAALTVITIAAAIVANSQSLGDVARHEKSRKASAPVAKRPPVTDDDLASSGKKGAPAEPGEKDDTASAAKHTPASRSAAAAEFKSKIKQQKQRVTLLELQMNDLQKAMDRWKSSDCTHVYHPGDPYGNACDVPPKLTAAHGQIKTEIQKERAALEAIQDKARAGPASASRYTILTDQ